MKLQYIVLGVTLAPFLTACGGGSSITVPEAPSIGNATLAGYEVSGTEISAITGLSSDTDNSVSVDDMAGTYDPDTWTGTLDGGGSFEFLVVGDAVALFSAEPSTGGTRKGLIGVLTPSPGDLSGSVSYSGQSVALINDGTYLWDLLGTVDATISFNNGGASQITLDALNGTRTDMSATEIEVSDVATLVFDGLIVSNGAITGSEVELTSAQLAAGLTGGETVELMGNVFGADGAAIGAVFIIDDSLGGTITASGGAIAE